MKDEALKLALEALENAEYGDYDKKELNEAITAIKEALANEALEKMAENARELGLGYEPEQEPVEVDQATMELAESVGLIGPTSRTHDLHQAIQRFHDLICVNATVKAAQMAADVIRESTPPQRTWVGLTDEEIEQGCKESWVTEQAWQSAVWWAEAKLKEKNA